MKMKEVIIPKEYNYVESYLTMKCNMNCSYCINDLTKKERNRKELTGNQWIDSLNKIDFRDVPITLGGGEPSLHRDFYDIINGLEQPVDLLTNLNFNVNDFVKNVSPDNFTQSDKDAYHSIRCSYHIGQSDETKILENAKVLQDNGFNIGIFGLNHPYNINKNMKMAFNATKEGLHFYVKDFLGKVDGQMIGFYKYPDGLDGIEKKVMCKTRELLIASNGSVHKCHRDLYNKEFVINNITDKDFKINNKFRYCNKYGKCNLCDIKSKTNLFLNSIDCQVQIKKLHNDVDMLKLNFGEQF